MSPSRGACADFQFGFWNSTNSVGYINTAKSLQKSRKQFASRRKRSSPFGPVSCLGYTYILNGFSEQNWNSLFVVYK